MLRLSVCLEMFWPETPFEQRPGRLAGLGYPAFEFWGWKDKDLGKLRAAAREHGLTVAAILAEPGFAVTQRESAQSLVEGVKASAEVAHSLDCPTLIVTTGNLLPDESFEVTRRRVVRRLSAMAAVAEREGVTLVLEPLNPLVDHFGYWLTKLSDAAGIAEEVGSPNLKILMDIYHQQITEGNIVARIRQYAPLIGHYHCAGVPGRHELLPCELDYRFVFQAIEETGYSGYVGLEFRPAGDPIAALRQALDLAG